VQLRGAAVERAADEVGVARFEAGRREDVAPADEVAEACLVRLDFLYLERWSVFLDLSILVKAIPRSSPGRGASEWRFQESRSRPTSPHS
jgi:hypothetical protein